MVHITCSILYEKDIVKNVKEYIYVGKNLNWVEAVSECRSMNAELALIESEEQNKKGSGCKVHGLGLNWLKTGLSIGLHSDF